VTLPQGYKPGDKSKEGGGHSKAIVALIAIVIIAIIIAVIAWGLKEDQRKMDEYAAAGCIPTSWSYTGSPTTYSCPPGTPEDVGK
jgi:hypothetical protein